MRYANLLIILQTFGHIKKILCLKLLVAFLTLLRPHPITIRGPYKLHNIQNEVGFLDDARRLKTS